MGGKKKRGKKRGEKNGWAGNEAGGGREKGLCFW